LFQQTRKDMNKERINTQFDITKDLRTQRNMNVQETLSVLKSAGYRLWSWGATKFTNVANLALAFRVRGRHFKGYVYISVNASDIYDVYLVNNRDRIIDVLNDIYVEDLFDTIDKRIEYIPEYTH